MTEEEMRAAMERNRQQAEQLQAAGESGQPGLLRDHPWILPAAGALALLIIVYLAYRLIARRR